MSSALFGYTVHGKVNGKETLIAKGTTTMADCLMSYVTSNAQDVTSNTAIAALNYGTAAQMHFAYHTERLANAGLTEAQRTVTPAGDYGTAQITDLPGAKAKILGASLLSEDTIAMKLYFLIPAETAALGWRIEQASDPSFSDAITLAAAYTAHANVYSSKTAGIAPINWNKTYYYRITDAAGNALSETLAYSVAAYCQSKTADEGVSPVANAILAFYDAATAYAYHQKAAYRVTDEFPTMAGDLPSGAWGYYTVQSDRISRWDYTALTAVKEQDLLGALGLSDGNGALGNGIAIAGNGTDVAYGFLAPRDGVITISSETLQRLTNGTAALTIYKNNIHIWPLTDTSYTVPTSEKASVLNFKTAVKAGDVIFFRLSANGQEAAKVKLAPVITYTNAPYTPEADLVLTRPAINSISGAGATLPAGSLAATGRTPAADEIAISAAEFSALFLSGDLAAGATYRLTDTAPLLIGLTGAAYDGRDCTVIAPGGITFTAPGNVQLSNLTVADGRMIIAQGNDVTLTGVECKAGLLVQAGCQSLRMDNCRITAKDTAFENRSGSLTAVGCYFAGAIAASDAAADGALYENCVFKGEEVAILLSTGNSTVWYSTIHGSVATGKEKTQNLLVAMNRFKNLGGVSYDGTHNSVILLNEVEHITVKNSTNAYVCNNELYGDTVFDRVNYLLATRNNTLGKIEAANIQNFNGDNVTDVNARTAYGVNEDLLPHINKDAFINMERKDYVRLSDGSKLKIDEYINRRSKNNGMLIIAPGAYSTNGRVYLQSIKNCTVYAYGVLYEKYDFFSDVFNIRLCENYAFRGLTVDMVLNGCGHMIVLKKENGTVYYRAAAGMLQDLTDTNYFSEGGNGIAFMGYRAGEDHPYADISLGDMTYDATTGLLASTPSTDAYNKIQPGDMMTCRANGNNVANLYENTAVQFEDVTILSGSIRCFWDSYAVEGTILNRVMVSPAPAKVIDQATYEEYKALNAEYGVDTLVYIDEFGNYRGTPARTVTADSTHTSNSLTGMKATSCIFEGLSDDGTNQQGFHGRLAGYDPATGTITYKEKVSSLGYTSVCANFAVGDRVYVYTSAGKTVCDTPALSVTTQLSEINGFMHYEVRVDPAAFDHALLSGYDLTADGANDRRILIDNRTRNGDGFIFDNMLIQNIRSRGFLVKCADNEIKHCTFRNIGMAAVGLIFEPEWGESGVCDNTLIAYNYFENTGYFINQTLYSPITIKGLGASTDEDCLPYQNIQIIGNVMRDRATDHALYLNSAMNVLVRDNDFGTKQGETAEKPHAAVFVNYARDVRFENNTYSPYLTDITDHILVNGNAGITGSDVGTAIPDDPTASAKHTAAFIDHTPTTDENNNLIFNEYWSAGYTTVDSIATYKPFAIMTTSGWLSATANSLWSSSGGLYANKDYRYAALSKSNACIRYTAEYSGTALLRLSSFLQPYASGSGSADGYFAIFVNGEMVWPTKNGSYTNGADWYLVSRETTHAILQDSLSSLKLSLNAGDEIMFVAKRHESWSAFAVHPVLYYTEIKE